jgi:hypothetical protein
MMKRMHTALCVAALAILAMAPSAPTFAAAVTNAASATVSTATLHPASYTTITGRDGGQPVTNLWMQDQSGTQNDWSKYVEFDTVPSTHTVYSGYRTYTLPASVSPNSITGLQVQANYLGQTKQYQTWTWRLYNWQTGSYVALGDNATATDWVWTLLTFRAGGTIASYISSSNLIRVEVDSNNASDNMDLDYEAVTVIYGSTTTGLWHPAPGTTWYWQLDCPSGQGPPCLNMNEHVQIYDIDGFDTPATTVATLHAKGIKVICYMDAGTWESGRPDASLFPAAVLGQPVSGWLGERWLDIRQTAILEPIMEHRANLCRAKGFDAIEWDNVDGYSNPTGFPLSYQNQITYDTFLATYTHALGLSVVLKNDNAQIKDLQPLFDLALDEQCFEYAECATETPFIGAGKAVLEVEYNLSPAQFCPQARILKLSAARANLDLDGTSWIPCW